MSSTLKTKGIVTPLQSTDLLAINQTIKSIATRTYDEGHKLQLTRADPPPECSAWLFLSHQIKSTK